MIQNVESPADSLPYIKTKVKFQLIKLQWIIFMIKSRQVHFCVCINYNIYVLGTFCECFFFLVLGGIFSFFFIVHVSKLYSPWKWKINKKKNPLFLPQSWVSSFFPSKIFDHHCHSLTIQKSKCLSWNCTTVNWCLRYYSSSTLILEYNFFLIFSLMLILIWKYIFNLENLQFNFHDSMILMLQILLALLS